ncbi:uncharacterized protein LOC111716796 [Eurytemora carolleeae]|uniref:uncharacterized protein LOC111716796 n=1 Tax=Eurytemora carolleeae TaxID=1294199 RepID=UPI000C764FD8|nr:uncharacterized protein LOC111716796 [Eurytemora carolleeae]|eukprot:XP_023348047.1 uncharacterized protein LOC111716796 [Eurytemora affinis]
MTEISTVCVNVTEMVERNDEFTKTVTGIMDDVSKAESITEVMDSITEAALSNNKLLEDNGSGNGMVIVVCIVGGVLFCVIILAVYLRYRNSKRYVTERKGCWKGLGDGLPSCGLGWFKGWCWRDCRDIEDKSANEGYLTPRRV